MWIHYKTMIFQRCRTHQSNPDNAPKTKESYIRSHGKAPSDLIKTLERAKTMPKQNTHTVTRNVSTGAKGG